MKVLHITNNYPTDKSPIFGIFVKEQIDSLGKIGIQNSVFFINGREKGKLEYLKSTFRLSKFLKKNKFDVIHCHHVLSAICLIMSGQGKQSKAIVSFQNDPSNELGKFTYSFVKRRIKFFILKNRSDLVDSMNVFYLPNGVNTTIFRKIDREEACAKLNLCVKKKYILFVSSNFIRRQKRHDRFEQTIEILRKKYRYNNIEELQLIATRRELVPYYFNAASIHLLTSDFEGSPNSVKEAMACNLSVVSTNVGNVTELLCDVKDSYVSNSNNPEELATLINHILSRNNEKDGRIKLLDKNLSIEKVALKLKKIYNSII